MSAIIPKRLGSKIGKELHRARIAERSLSPARSAGMHTSQTTEGVLRTVKRTDSGDASSARVVPRWG